MAVALQLIYSPMPLAAKNKGMAAGQRKVRAPHVAALPSPHLPFARHGYGLLEPNRLASPHKAMIQ